MTKFSWLLACLVAIGLIALIACGGSESGNVSPVTVASTAAPTATPTAAPTRTLPQADETAKPTIVFSDLNWTSAQVQNRIAQFIVEKGYGYETDAIFGSSFQGLLKGDIHVVMEVWLPNQNETWEPAVANGQVISLGMSLGKDWQSAFVIPGYLAKQYPGLKSVQDLKKAEYRKLFETTDSRGKARLVSCVVGWSCGTVNAAQIEGYGLSDYTKVVKPWSQHAMFADLQGAYDKKEPWLGYMWGAGDPALLLDLVRLEEPAYSDECWNTTKACGYEDATVMIGVHPSLTTSAPDIVEFLRNWGFDIDLYKNVAKYTSDNPGTESKDAALWFLNNYESEWSSWVPAYVATKVKEALDTQ